MGDCIRDSLVAGIDSDLHSSLSHGDSGDDEETTRGAIGAGIHSTEHFSMESPCSSSGRRMGLSDCVFITGDGMLSLLRLSTYCPRLSTYLITLRELRCFEGRPTVELLSASCQGEDIPRQLFALGMGIMNT